MGKWLLPVAGPLCLLAVLTACEDDFGEKESQSGVLTVRVTVPEGWTSGMPADDSRPDSRCVSVDAADTESGTPLYVHTIESDNAVSAPVSRGSLESSISNFSMSAICYTGTYNETWTPDFAYDLAFTVNGSTASGSEKLLWPAGGKVRFFAFAAGGTGSRPFTLSGASEKGTPKITYTVPGDFDSQHDLMAACTDATSSPVELNFRHILTAVQIVTAKDMIPGTITGVTLSGVAAAGTYTPDPAGGVWEPGDTASFTVTRDVTVASGYTQPEGSPDLAGDGTKPVEVTGDTTKIAMLMIPQTLGEKAELKITFREAMSGKEFLLTAGLNGKEWPAGKKVIYSISPSSMHITPCVEFSKKQDDVLPYSGVWYDVVVKSYARVTKTGGSTYYMKLPPPDIDYSFTDGTKGTSAPLTSGGEAFVYAGSSDIYTDLKDVRPDTCMYVLSAQSDFVDLRRAFATAGADIDKFNGSADGPLSLLRSKSNNESANCYMLDEPGYYKFPVVYGNAYRGGTTPNSAAYTIENATTKNAMLYYPDYKGNPISGYAIAGINPATCDAVLAWQDSPDLVDDVRLVSDATDAGLNWVVFRVRRHSINQGNALIVVRDASKEIAWSWHIWVTQHTKAWVDGSDCRDVESIYGESGSFKFTGKTYGLTSVNLGYCDPHEGNAERKFTFRFKVRVNDNTTAEVTDYICTNGSSADAQSAFTQAEFKGSLGGDNPYWQWGRSAPTPGGIYNASTPKYYFKSSDYSELNMENKPLFNIYDDGTRCYALTRNTPGTSDTEYGDEKGCTVPWAISHPHVFVMSKYSLTGKPYREHWHTLETVPYAPSGNMSQMWNPEARTTDSNDMQTIEGAVSKSVYDPCPAGYLVPPAAAFSAFAYPGTYKLHNLYGATTGPAGYAPAITALSPADGYSWTVTAGGNQFKFPATGVRDKSPRDTEFKGISLSSSRAGYVADKYGFWEQTFPAFRILTYLSSSTISPHTVQGGGRQVAIFYIDNRHSTNTSGNRVSNTSLTCMTAFSAKPAMGSFCLSSNSYGFVVRPMREKESY